jgi:hypothetical protein
MNKNVVNLRIGDIKLRLINDRYEIVKYHPNEYYDNKDDYEPMNGNEEYYQIKKLMYYPFCTPSSHIHKSCFENPESCYTIASFDIDEEGANLVWCGNRPLKLSKDDFKDFMLCVRFGYDYIDAHKNGEDCDYNE